MSQLARVQAAMKEIGLDALLISDIVNVQWISGFTGSSGVVVVTPGAGHFITDGRYDIQAKQQVSELEVHIFGGNLTQQDMIASVFADSSAKRVGFEPSVTFGQLEQWREKHSGVEFTSAGSLVSNLRKIKTEGEIAKITRACEVADACMVHAMRMLQIGVSEIDIGLDIEFFFRRQGAAIGFEPIVASGPNSAKPHARPSERRLEKGDFVTLDIGCILDGYASDFTRTFVIGEASERHVEIYNQVLQCQVAACEATVDGANGRDIDALARKILDEKDLNQYYTHSLGHGLGRVVHDPGRLSVQADEAITLNQVWTIEPGVYIEGFGGVRIEDDVVVTKDGPLILTKTPKELLVL